VEKIITDDLDALLDILPLRIKRKLVKLEDRRELLEVVLDLGRTPEARFAQREVILDPHEVTDKDIEYVTSSISGFGGDNRSGIERTLHRISAIRNRKGRIVGLTCRVGRAVYGTINIIEDLVQSGKSILLLGRPGSEGLIPSAWISDLVGGNSLWANLFASVVGTFMYFATLTEVPILQGLMGAGMGNGPALALLLAGPALSLPNMLVIRSIMGTRKTLVFVALVVVMSAASGMIFGLFTD